jgi:hypothetical protein
MADQIKAARYLEVSAKTRKGLDKVFEVAVSLVQEVRGVVSEKDAGDGGDATPSPVTTKKKKKGCIMM